MISNSACPACVPPECLASCGGGSAPPNPSRLRVRHSAVAARLASVAPPALAAGLRGSRRGLARHPPSCTDSPALLRRPARRIDYPPLAQSSGRPADPALVLAVGFPTGSHPSPHPQQSRFLLAMNPKLRRVLHVLFFILLAAGTLITRSSMPQRTGKGPGSGTPRNATSRRAVNRSTSEASSRHPSPTTRTWRWPRSSCNSFATRSIPRLTCSPLTPIIRSRTRPSTR